MQITVDVDYTITLHQQHQQQQQQQWQEAMNTSACACNNLIENWRALFGGVVVVVVALEAMWEIAQFFFGVCRRMLITHLETHTCDDGVWQPAAASLKGQHSRTASEPIANRRSLFVNWLVGWLVCVAVCMNTADFLIYYHIENYDTQQTHIHADTDDTDRIQPENAQ